MVHVPSHPLISLEIYLTAFLIGAIWHTGEASQDPAGIEIEFAPMDMGGGFMDMLAAANGGQKRMRGPANHGREAELDNMLNGMISGMLGGRGPVGPMGLMDPRGGGFPGMTEEIVVQGPDGAQVLTLSGGSKKAGGRSSLPAGIFRDLFPPVIGFDPSRGGGGPMMVEEGPFGGGVDPFMMDMMQDLDRGFATEILPAIHKAAEAEHDPQTCREDVKKNCQGAKSHLHCLGVNHDSISDACRKEVGQTVPFRCHDAIDRYCDVMQMGILDCLSSHMADLKGSCQDAVRTTKHVINKVNSQQASLIDRSTGVTNKVSSPTAGASPEKEAKLDAKLGLKPTATEAKLDAKLGVKPAVTPDRSLAAVTAETPAATARTAPVAVKSAAATATATAIAPHASWRPVSTVGIASVIALVAFAIYLATFTDHIKMLQKKLSHGEGLEGVKLLNTHVELPRPDAM